MKCTKLRIEDIYVILFDRAKHRLDDIYFETFRKSQYHMAF